MKIMGRSCARPSYFLPVLPSEVNLGKGQRENSFESDGNVKNCLCQQGFFEKMRAWLLSPRPGHQREIRGAYPQDKGLGSGALLNQGVEEKLGAA